MPDGFGLSLAGSATALLLAALLFAPFAPVPGRQGGLRLLGWAATGAMLFLVALLIVQVPAQAALARALLAGVSPFWLADHTWLLPILLALVAALLQEGARLAAVAWAVRDRPGPSASVRAGAVVGAGIGLVEAVMVLGAVPPASFDPLSLAVLERVGAIAFHTGAGATLGAALRARRAVVAFALVVALHALIDGLAALHDAGLASFALAEAVNLAVGLGLLAVAVALAWRPVTPPPAAAAAGP